MYEPHKRAYRHPKYKTPYRIKKWPEYEKSLCDRGDITFWLRGREEAIRAWTPPKNGKRGGQEVYSDIAIKTSLSVRILFHLVLRQTEGFLRSIFKSDECGPPLPRSHHLVSAKSNRRRA